MKKVTPSITLLNLGSEIDDTELAEARPAEIGVGPQKTNKALRVSVPPEDLSFSGALHTRLKDTPNDGLNNITA